MRKQSFNLVEMLIVILVLAVMPAFSLQTLTFDTVSNPDLLYKFLRAPTFAELLTGQAGATFTGGIFSVNASSNYAVNIGTGTSTGAVTIGGGSNTFAVASSGLDISTAGAISNATTISAQTVTASVGVQSTATAVTVTADGTGTGLIPANASIVVITSDSANKQAKLPAPVVGMQITIIVGATGCELIATGTNVKINDVVCSATNEAALAADTHYVCTCVSATEWIMVGYTKLGAVDTPVVPDAL